MTHTHKTQVQQSVGLNDLSGDKHDPADCFTFQANEQRRSDGGYIGIYTLPKSVYLTNFLCGYWLFFFLFDPGQIRYCASVRLSSCFFYLLTHHNLYSPQMKFLATPLLTRTENMEHSLSFSSGNLPVSGGY